MFGWRPAGSWPLVQTYRTGVVHVRAGENLLEGQVRLRCSREVGFYRSDQFAGSRDDVTCARCLAAVDKVRAPS